MLTACAPLPPIATGYVEGEYVQIAAVTTAQIQTLAVKREDRVAVGRLLVELERQDAEIGLVQADAALARAERQLAHLREGRRPEEIAVIDASLASAAAQAEEATREEQRQGIEIAAEPVCGSPARPRPGNSRSRKCRRRRARRPLPCGLGAGKAQPDGPGGGRDCRCYSQPR